ncbi:ATP-binding protein [Streptomyces sp. NBC_01429]|uniref:ATP-binding protein n=1 Tax=Streptomyces sp. NBC_01429 TaxID=2903862 RepID=UPI002E2E0797|nr:ATP-binding protein [Streptomyces sp. NBC_01429]
MLTDSGLAHDVYDSGPAWLPLTRIPLPHRPEASPRARRHTREVLALRRVDGELAAAVELAVSELVTNAVRHGVCLCGCTRGPVSLALLRAEGRLRVEVADPSRTPPRWPTGIESVDAETAAEAEEGRGLLLVTALAADWGDRAGPVRGKVVWCEFEARSAGGGADGSGGGSGGTGRGTGGTGGGACR